MGTKITELPELAENAAPSDVVPVVDVSTGVTKKVTAQRAAVGGITGGTLPGVDFADPVLKTSAPDLGGSGVQLTPGGLTSGGTSGGTDIIVSPGAAAAGQGKAVLISAGTGAASQNGGPLTLDAGGPNGGGSVAGNVRIGRDVAAEVLIGKEGGGATVTLEGTITTVGHTPSATAHVATKGYVDTAIAAPVAPGVISGTTYTVQAADHGKVYACENAAGCAVSVPDDLPAGTQVGFYGTAGVVTFAGAATILLPAAFSAETAEAFSLALIHITDDPTSALLTGDLAAA